MSEKWVQASEIATYLYCRRAWWLQRVEKRPSVNIRQMESGRRWHTEHGRSVQLAVWSRRLAYFFLFCLVAFITFQLLMNAQ